MIRCTVDPQINHEARIHHLNVKIVVLASEFRPLMRLTKPMGQP